MIRKLVASKDLDWFVCLQIPENDEKSNVYLNHFDIRANKQVCCVEYLTLNSKLAMTADGARYSKTIAVSKDQKVVFAAGVSRITGTEMGYIAAHEVGNKFKEVAVISTNESSHKTKKGFYRISRLEDIDILVLGGWLDVYLYYYVNKKFEKIVFLPTIHESSSFVIQTSSTAY